MEQRKGYGTARNLAETTPLSKSIFNRDFRSGRSSSPPMELRKNSMDMGQKDLNQSAYIVSNMDGSTSRFMEGE